MIRQNFFNSTQQQSDLSSIWMWSKFTKNVNNSHQFLTPVLTFMSMSISLFYFVLKCVCCDVDVCSTLCVTFLTEQSVPWLCRWLIPIHHLFSLSFCLSFSVCFIHCLLFLSVFVLWMVFRFCLSICLSPRLDLFFLSLFLFSKVLNVMRRSVETVNTENHL